jgi:hypothetical protein
MGTPARRDLVLDLGLPVLVSAKAYTEARETQLGWCANCRDFTTPGIKPDKIAARCFDCGKHVVVGVKVAEECELIKEVRS